MTEKISYDRFLEMIRNPQTSDAEIAPYVELISVNGALDFEVNVNPLTVEMTAADEELESAMSIGNGLARFRRRSLFFSVAKSHPERAVVVSEGDSWFQFPILIEETIDKLLPNYNIWSLGSAGATLEEMTSGPIKPRGFEFLLGLRKHRKQVRAFLFSGAGNDVLGEDPVSGDSMLASLLRPYNGDRDDIEGHIDKEALHERIEALESKYRKVIETVHSEPGLERLPILIHGYDYAFPYPAGPEDIRNPVYAKRDQWLGRAFQQKAIADPQQRRKIIIVLIDRLYSMLEGLRDTPGQKNIHVVDCRGAMPRVTDWNDEIHGTSKGFSEVGRRFEAKLKEVIGTEGVS
ncbi:hypothetical protein [Yoonia sp. I 8.24]|uniref:hypothetical protein n=1 Tax=Yoonia sp. I 8.24 TaxID=1537229 RepID=UPI001EE0EAFA|nr:hypothetical protein [Yoonia sp. I 8.24]MCG3266695.1 hypothetical protein [Yoonia sp. I 8.24]